MNFKTFKDRAWSTASLGAGILASTPAPIGRNIFAASGKALWLGYLAPASPLRSTMGSFCAVIGKGPPRRLFADFASGFMLFLYRMERLRRGHTAEIDSLLDIPERDRLERLLQSGGLMMVMPHTNGSLSMVRGLGRHFDVLMLVRTTRDSARAASQHTYYAPLGCEILDVRRASEASVARAVMKALRSGRIVIVTGDLIKKPPPAEAPIDKASDLVRAEAFGQPLGAPGWPARFALRAGAPLVPVMVEQTADKVVLHLGPTVEGDDVVVATREWVRGMADFLARYPSDWAFVFDRRWARLLAAAASERSGKAD